MLIKNALAALATSALLVAAIAVPASAEDIPDMEKQNIEGAGPDTDASASKGTDPSIPEQEKANIDGAGPNTDAGASTGASTGTSDSDQSIPGGNRENLE